VASPIAAAAVASLLAAAAGVDSHTHGGLAIVLLAELLAQNFQEMQPHTNGAHQYFCLPAQVMYTIPTDGNCQHTSHQILLLIMGHRGKRDTVSSNVTS
jgi:hypothetical protein